MSEVKFEHVKISGITACVPENFIKIDDEIEFYGNDVKLLERNKKILGLGVRHVCDANTTSADLCDSSANDLLDSLKIERDSIDVLIMSSISLEFITPATACILQHRLGLSENCTCFDLTGLSCSAYVHGLWLAHSLIASGAAKRVLLLNGDTLSTHTDRRNRISNMLFGDAGTATLIEATAEKRESCFYTGTRGEGWDKIIAPAGGSYLPIRQDIAGIEEQDDKGNVWHLWDKVMKGLDVFKFATDVGPKGISKVLDMAHKGLEDIDYFAFHQANKQIVQSIAMYSRLPKDKYSAEAFSLYGNCGSASVILDICRRFKEKEFKNCCLVTFGVGLSFGFATLDVSGIYIGDVKRYKTPENKMTRAEKIKYWISYFKGE